MAAVRAKFKVSEITQHAYGKKRMWTIKLQPVFGEEGTENRSFWEASPNGEIRLGTINEGAAALFDVEAEYYVDFTPAKDSPLT